MGASFSGHQAAASEAAAGGGGDQNYPGLADLPESCVALILSSLEPLEICRLAILNRTFRLASSADCVWEPKLPPNYEILISKLFQNDDHHHDPEISTPTNLLLPKKDIYARLCCPNRFGGDTMEVWMDKGGGGLCVAISWKGLKITGITDRRYWNPVSTHESRFQSIAYLKQIWWLEVEGDLELEFPAGTYSLYFRMQLAGRSSRRVLGGGRRVCIVDHDGVHGWNAKPVRFHLSSSSGHQTTAQYHLNEAEAAGGGGRWIHYHVGDFVVDPNNRENKEDMSNSDCNRTRLKFSMTQIDCTHTKGGLCLDCVLVYPTNAKLPAGTIKQFL